MAFTRFWSVLAQCLSLHGSSRYSNTLPAPKVYIPRTTNIWKKVLTKAIWADKNGLVSGRLAQTSSKTEILHKQNRNLDFNPEFSSWYRIFFHPKDLKSENINPYFTAHTISRVFHSRLSVFIVLWIYNFGQDPTFINWSKRIKRSGLEWCIS